MAAIPVQHWTQPSGAKVYLVESPSIPMVDVRIDFDAGSRRDPADKAGLASAAAEIGAKGVTAAGPASGAGAAGPAGMARYEQALDENQLSEAWTDLGADFSANVTADRMSFSLRSLNYPDLLPKVAQLAARQLGDPAFPETVWERERQRMAAAIREANTRPATVAGNAYNAAVYGTHPYGFETTETTLSHISAQDMRQMYRALVQPCRAKVSVVGALTRAQADALVATLLSRLQPDPAGSCVPLPVVPEVAPLTAANVRYIPFVSAQAQVLMGQPGYKRSDPDYFALLVGNYVLGGGFVSRLTQEVREKRGLSYSVYSNFSPGLHAGAFTIGLQTRPDQAAQAVQISRDVLARFVAGGPTEAELKEAKSYLVGGFPLLIDSNRKLLGNVSNIAWNDLPLDYLETWTRNVERITVAEVKAAFARKLQPQRMVTITVGAAPHQ
jgi:zinc protease